MTTQIQTTTATNEVTVNLATGEAFISFAEAAKRLNVPKTTLYDCINRTVKADTKQGLSSEMLSVAVQYFALDAKTVTTEAKEAMLKDLKLDATIEATKATIEISKAKGETAKARGETAKLKLQALKDKLVKD